MTAIGGLSHCQVPLLVAALVLVAPGAAAVIVDAVNVVSDPGADKTYASGDTIEIAVSFDGEVHVTHDPNLTFRLQVGVEMRSMRFADGSGTRELLFRYRVQTDDRDGDGISFEAGAMTGGTLSDRDGAPVALDLPQRLLDDSGHLVDAVGPRATGVTIVSDAGGDDTYATGDRIDLEVSFDEDIGVSGAPELVVSVGTLSRRAALLDARPRQLTFRYIVQQGDRDEDGIAVDAEALVGGTIRDAVGNDAIRTLRGLTAQSAHRVDALSGAVAGVEITSNPGSDRTYGLGDDIEVSVAFDEVVHVTSPDPTAEPRVLVLALAVGGGSRAADFVGGSGTRSLRFRYSVQIGDLDEDGISIGADALMGGSIADSAGNPVVRHIQAVPEQQNHKVDAGGAQGPAVTAVQIVSRPQSGDTYGTGENIRLEVRFEEEVHVTGEPLLVLSIGASSRDATFVSGSGTESLTFRYTVREHDLDEDGISIAPNALRGGTIEDSVGNPAERGFRALPADRRHRVRGLGSIDATVQIVSAPRSGDTYGLGEDIVIAITFAGVVHVTGDPVLLVSLGGNVHSAVLVTGSGTGTLRFRYTVQAGDRDEDGISVGSGALEGGEITSGTGGLVRVSFQSLPAQPGHKVDGLVAPRVQDVQIVSSPASGDTYGPGEEIDVAVVFDEAVHVTGSPALSVSVGGNTRAAAFLAGSGTETLTFRYTVQEGDIDEDGISVAANALSGGAIAGASGDPVSPVFEGIAAQSGHKVDAARPRVSEVHVVSTPAREDTYRIGEAIEVAVTFDDIVHVTGGPVLTLSVGGGSQQAGLVSGSGTETLLFRYTVREDDLDDDGISVAANALTGGVIEDGHGNAVDRTFAALPAAAGHKVDAARPTVSEVHRFDSCAGGHLPHR